MATCPTCLTHYEDGVDVCEKDGVALVPDATLGIEPELETGTRVGEYVVEQKIGAGTFGVVYRGIQPLIGKQVAIKVLSRKYSADPHVVSRFIAEARAVNQIRHKNIIDIFSFGQLEDGRHYHVMELLEGEPLDERLVQSRGVLPVEVLMPILRGLARALDAAHASGIAHRDLKPANVFLAKDEDGTPFPKLLDFGIAKLLTDEMPRQHHTATGAAVGTPDYMSPEQCQGPDVDHRTDIYSFGVMTYQLVTGHLPHQGNNVVEVLMKQMTAEPTPPSQANPSVPPGFDGPILKMMAKVPEERPANCALAIQALTDAALEAGFDLPSASHSGEQDARLVRSGPGAHRVPTATPSGGAPALAATIASSSGEHLRAPEVPSSRSRAPLFIGTGVMVLAVAAVPFLLDDGGDAPPTPPAPARAEAPPPAPPPAAPARIQLAFTGAPAGAVVLGADGQALGQAPGPITVPRGTEKLQLIFRAEGFHDLQREIVPVASATLSVSMEAVAKPAAEPKAKVKAKAKRKATTKKKPKKSKDELEVPDWD